MNIAGTTTLITGASSGIGAAYARAFAARGANLVLVARRVERLEQIAEELRAEHRVEVDVLSADLAQPNAGTSLWQRLGGRRIDIVVNNAGFGVRGHFVDEDPARTADEIRLNIATLVELTRLALPDMLERNSGAIINVASTASFQAVPGMAVYAATKAFVRSFTEAVWGEIRGSNVRVLAVSPGATATEFFDVAGGAPGGTLVPVERVIDRTFRALDARRSTPSVVVGGSNAVLAKLSQMFPKRLTIAVAGGMFLTPRRSPVE